MLRYRSHSAVGATLVCPTGFDGFVSDACLINRYEPGARLSLHQDRNERTFDAPIVSVSLAIPAVFLFGGLNRSERPRRGYRSRTAMWWSGADRPDCVITGSCHSRKTITLPWVGIGSISLFAKPPSLFACMFRCANPSFSERRKRALTYLPRRHASLPRSACPKYRAVADLAR